MFCGRKKAKCLSIGILLLCFCGSACATNIWKGYLSNRKQISSIFELYLGGSSHFMQPNMLVLLQFEQQKSLFLTVNEWPRISSRKKEVVAKKNSKYNAYQLVISPFHNRSNWNVCPKHVRDAPGEKDAHVGYLWKSTQNELSLQCPYKVRVTVNVTKWSSLKSGVTAEPVTVNRWFWSIFSLTFLDSFFFSDTVQFLKSHCIFN